MCQNHIFSLNCQWLYFNIALFHYQAELTIYTFWYLIKHYLIPSSKKQESSKKKTYFCFIDYTKAFDCVDHKNLWEILKEMGIPDHLTCLLRSSMQVKKQELELVMEQQTGSKLGKGYIKAVHCHPAYCPPAYMQSTSHKMPGWKKHKLESRLLGDIISDTQYHHPYGRKQRTNELVGERGEWESWLKTQHSENEDHGI